MSWLLLFGMLSFISGYHLDNLWLFMLAGLLLFIAAIPLLFDYPVTFLVVSASTAAVRFQYFSPAPWYMHLLWILLVLVISIPIIRNFFFRT